MWMLLLDPDRPEDGPMIGEPQGRNCTDPGIGYNRFFRFKGPATRKNKVQTQSKGHCHIREERIMSPRQTQRIPSDDIPQIHELALVGQQTIGSGL